MHIFVHNYAKEGKSTCRIWHKKQPFSEDFSRTHLSLTANEPLVGGDFLESHGTAGMEFLGGDSYLSSESELRSVGK